MNRVPSSNSVQNNSLFVGDLPKFCSEVELEELFTRFGQIIDVKIKRNSNTGKTLSYGFVTFVEEAAATQAMSALDGSMFSGRKLRVRLAMYNTRSQDSSAESIINSVYVKYATLKKVDFFITEEEFHKVFDRFGSVLDVSIKESYIDKRTNKQSGYGFVHFSGDSAGVEAAIQAVANIDNATIDGVTYNVELSKNLLKQFHSSAAGNSSVSTSSATASSSAPKTNSMGYHTYTDGASSPERHLINEVNLREDYGSSGFAARKPIAVGNSFPMKHGAEDYNSLGLSQQEMHYSHGGRGARANTYDNSLRTSSSNPLDHLTHHTYIEQDSQHRVGTRRSTVPPTFGSRHPATINYVGGNNEIHHRPHVPTYRATHMHEYTSRFVPRPPVQDQNLRYSIGGSNNSDVFSAAPIGNSNQMTYSPFPNDNMSDYSTNMNLIMPKPYSNVDLGLWQESFERLDISSTQDDFQPILSPTSNISSLGRDHLFPQDFSTTISTAQADLNSSFELGHWATEPLSHSLPMNSSLLQPPDLSGSMAPSSPKMNVNMHYSPLTNPPLPSSTSSATTTLLPSHGHLFPPPPQRMSLNSMYDEDNLTQPRMDYAGERNTAI